MKYVIAFAVFVLPIASRFLAGRWLSRRRTQARTQAWLTLRTELGLEPVDNAGEIPADNLPFKIGLFEGGENRWACNAMQGAALGFRTLFLDYQYTEWQSQLEGGVKSVDRFYTVAAFENKQHNLARFELRKRKRLLARQKIKLEGNLEFNKHFTLTGADAAGVGGLFTPQLLNFLVSANLSPKWHIEASGSWLVFWMKQLQPKNLARFLQDTSLITASFFQNCGSLEVKARYEAVGKA